MNQSNSFKRTRFSIKYLLKLSAILVVLMISIFSQAQTKINFHNYRFGKDTLKNYYVLKGQSNIRKFVFECLISKTNENKIDVHLILYGIKTHKNLPDEIMAPIALNEEGEIEFPEATNIIFGNQEFHFSKIYKILTENTQSGTIDKNLSYILLTPEYNSANQTISFSVQGHTEEIKRTDRKILGVSTPQHTDPSPPAPASILFNIQNK